MTTLAYAEAPLAILWQVPREFFDFPRLPANARERLSLASPTRDKIRTVAFVHALHHACSNGNFCFSLMRR